MPWEKLRELGLASGRELKLSEEDKEALLHGRRTSMLRLENLVEDGFSIREIDLKLSMARDGKGRPELMAHPIHRFARIPEGLSEPEATLLMSGKNDSVFHALESPGEEPVEVIYEYDAETNEFVRTITSGIIAPDEVNGIELSKSQQDRYRKGLAVEMADGTSLRYTGLDPAPVRSNKLLLIASVVVDGGLTYFAFKALKALDGSRNNDLESAKLSKQYQQTRDKMEAETSLRPKEQFTETGISRSYTRSGHSR